MLCQGKRKIGYAYDPKYTRIADLLPSNIGRATLVDDLIKSRHLLDHCHKIISPSLASKEQLTKFHDAKFISFLLGEDVSLSDSEFEDETAERTLQARFGLEFDCPLFEGLEKYVQAVAGTTIECARYLQEGYNTSKTDQYVAINWHGGRHHAGKAKCSGFCYVNDIVLGILELRKTFEKVMYIDLDLHHGDGVEKSFAHSNTVLTLSLHRYDKGFFPGSGNTKFNGKAKGRNYTVNVGLKPGLGDASMNRLLQEVITPTVKQFKPGVLIVQCGADVLARDPTKEWNLSVKGHSAVIAKIVDYGLPTMLLGGGGYNHPDAARLWCAVLGRLTIGDEVDGWDLIPEECNTIEQYAKDGYAQFPDDTRIIEDLNLRNNFLDRVIEHMNEQTNKIQDDTC
ncbi:hypothetical protein V1512DRAFT_88086 [Lipomyces arxii]|uniref:uncharacterized protein n=1 Tax=Lipomyces arxii TaxID=56418 RepID=UPI0034CEFC43